MALTKEQLKEKLNNGAVAINVLRKDAYDQLHIKGSIHIRLEGDAADEFVKEVEVKVGKDKEIITYCSNLSCPTGPRAAKILQARGFMAEDYPGGIQEWHDAGLPVEGSLAG